MIINVRTGFCFYCHVSDKSESMQATCRHRDGMEGPSFRTKTNAKGGHPSAALLPSLLQNIASDVSYDWEKCLEKTSTQQTGSAVSAWSYCTNTRLFPPSPPVFTFRKRMKKSLQGSRGGLSSPHPPTRALRWLLLQSRPGLEAATALFALLLTTYTSSQRGLLFHTCEPPIASEPTTYISAPLLAPQPQGGKWADPRLGKTEKQKKTEAGKRVAIEIESL